MFTPIISEEFFKMSTRSVEHTFTNIKYLHILPPKILEGGILGKQRRTSPHKTGARNVHAC
jgi:hypothetical protein